MVPSTYDEVRIFDEIETTLQNLDQRAVRLRFSSPMIKRYLRYVHDILQTYLRSVRSLRHEYLYYLRHGFTRIIHFIRHETLILQQKTRTLLHEISAMMTSLEELNQEEEKQPYGRQTNHHKATLSIVKKCLQFLLVMSLSLTIACSEENYRNNLPSQEFIWLSTKDTAEGVYLTDIQLEWKYQSKEQITRIQIARSNSQEKGVASWTRTEGSKQSPFMSTNVVLEHLEEGNIGTIKLKLIRPYPVDFNKKYNCLISVNKNEYNQVIELRVTKLEYQPATDIVVGRPGDDIKLKWIYNYPLPVRVLVFENDRNIKTDMAYSIGKSEFNSEDEYIGRLRLDRKLHKGQEEITLTILNTIVDDYNHTYNSLAVAYNGYQNSSKLFLSEIPDDGNVDKETLFESTSSTGQRSIRVDPCLLGVSSSVWFILTSLSLSLH